MKTLWCRAHDPIGCLRIDQGRHPFTPALIRRLNRRLPGYHD